MRARQCLLVMGWPPTGVGGVNEAVLGLAHALQAAQRLNPIIAVTCWGGAVSLPARVRGIPVVALRLHDGYEAGILATLKSLARLPGDLLAIKHLLCKHEIGIVNLHFPSLGAGVFLILRRLGWYMGQVALTFHGSDIRGALVSPRLQRLAWKKLICGADSLFVCSQAIAADVSKLCPRRRPQVIHNGAEIELFRGIAKLPGSGRKRILNVARYEHTKSHDVLLTALRIVLERGLNCELTMIGGTGPTLAAVKQAAMSFGDRARVLVDVDHDRIPGHMADCDLFVLPSRAEAFGIVLIEAGAAGLPVIATRVGGIPEIIAHGSTGLLVEPDDPQALAEAMVRVLEDRELAASLAARLLAKAVGFTWQRHAEQYTAALL